MKILSRKIGYNHEPVFIAELGINHNGNLKSAFEIVDAAKAAGVEILKHQTHVAEDEMSQDAKKVIPGNSNKSIFNIISECALCEQDEKELMDYVISKGMIFISTPFSRAAADRLEKFNVPAYKIGSGECNNYPLIEHVANFKKPIILSTGMNTIESIRPAVEILEKYNIDYALLHTTNLYPTPYHLVRLDSLLQLKKEFPNAIIGLSDHTDNNFSCYGALALGASIIEKHFVDIKSRPGPDIVCSVTPDQVKEILKGCKVLFQERGGNKNVLLEEEKITSNFAYATVVTIKDLRKGEELSLENIWVKRPGTGEILAKDYKSLIGKKINKDIERDKHLTWKDII
jgi:N-acetylneuraminate synthase